MENLYELRQYDTPLLEFRLEEQGISLAAQIMTLDEEKGTCFRWICSSPMKAY